MKMVAYEKDGQESGRIEVTKLESKTLPAQLLEIPVGYRTVELQQAIQELMMAGMGMQAMPGGMSTNLPPGVAAQVPPEIAARPKAARSKAAASKTQ